MKQKEVNDSSQALKFLKELEEFQYRLSGYDKLWDIIFPDTVGRPQRVRIIRYRETWYLFHIDGKSCPIEVSPGGSISPSESMSFSGRAGLYGEEIQPILICMSPSIHIGKRSSWSTSGPPR